MKNLFLRFQIFGLLILSLWVTSCSPLFLKPTETIVLPFNVRAIKDNLQTALPPSVSSLGMELFLKLEISGDMSYTNIISLNNTDPQSDIIRISIPEVPIDSTINIKGQIFSELVEQYEKSVFVCYEGEVQNIGVSKSTSSISLEMRHPTTVNNSLINLIPTPQNAKLDSYYHIGGFGFSGLSLIYKSTDNKSTTDTYLIGTFKNQLTNTFSWTDDTSTTSSAPELIDFYKGDSLSISESLIIRDMGQNANGEYFFSIDIMQFSQGNISGRNATLSVVPSGGIDTPKYHSQYSNLSWAGLNHVISTAAYPTFDVKINGTVSASSKLSITGTKTVRITSATSSRATIMRASGFTDDIIVTTAGATLELSNIVLDGGYTTHSTKSDNPILRATTATLTIGANTLITNNFNTSNQGALSISGGTTFTMTGGKISGNKTEQVNTSSAVYIASSADNFVMQGGEICDNAGTASSGAAFAVLYAYGSSLPTMNRTGGLIRNNVGNGSVTPGNGDIGYGTTPTAYTNGVTTNGLWRTLSRQIVGGLEPSNTFSYIYCNYGMMYEAQVSYSGAEPKIISPASDTYFTSYTLASNTASGVVSDLSYTPKDATAPITQTLYDSAGPTGYFRGDIGTSAIEFKMPD